MYPVPVPYFVYRGQFLKADRDGVRGELFDREYVELSLSVSATIPVNSDDNAARRGMPDLKPTIELGPSLELHLWRSADRTMKLDLVMPLRVPITLESSPRSLQLAVRAAAEHRYRERRRSRGWNFGAGVGPVFAADKFHEYFYSVPRAFRDGRAGPRTTPTAVTPACTCWLSLSKRFPKYWVGAFLRYDWLGGAEFDDSPLVRRQNYLAGGFGIAWMIGESKRRVVVEPDEE